MVSANTWIAWNDGDPNSAGRWLVEDELIWGDMVGTNTNDLPHPFDPGPEEWLREYYGRNYRVERAERDAGQFYPRFYKGAYHVNLFGRLDPIPVDDRDILVSSFEQEEILVEELRAICRVTTPNPDTHNVYGSRIRNLLILASTEVEALMRGTLLANGYKPKPNPRFPNDDHLTMTDYVKLAGPMRLAEYEVRLTSQRKYPHIKPFGGWIDNKTKPDWYNAYNLVKHDREKNMHQATLKHAMAAVAAVHVLLIAQYGEEIRASSTFFQTTHRPYWPPVERLYTDPRNHDGWMPVPYAF